MLWIWSLRFMIFYAPMLSLSKNDFSLPLQVHFPFPPSVRLRSSTKKVFSKGSWTPPRSMTSLLFIKTQTSLAPHLDGSGTVHEDGGLGYRPQDTNCSPKTHHHHERWRRGQGYKRRTRASQEWSRSCDSCCPNLKCLANAKEGQSLCSLKMINHWNGTFFLSKFLIQIYYALFKTWKPCKIHHIHHQLRQKVSPKDQSVCHSIPVHQGERSVHRREHRCQ